MKKKIISNLLVLVLSMSVFVGCGSNADNVSDNAEITTEAPTTTSETTATPEPTEAPHEHAYVETITTEASCETDGEATYTCECGDTYTETIKALGHIYENYTSNNDATYTADGTETAKCNNCDVTDTRTAEGSMLTYTYTDMDATMYAQKTVNVRSLPNTDGEKLGSLSTNDEVKVTGQCAETSWYRIEYSGGVAYVSNSYLGNDKVVVQTEAPKQTNNGAFPYELYVVYYDEATDTKYYYKPRKANFFDYPQAVYDECKDYNRAHHSDDGVNPHAGFEHGTKDTGYDTADGDDIMKYIAW